MREVAVNADDFLSLALSPGTTVSDFTHPEDAEDSSSDQVPFSETKGWATEITIMRMTSRISSSTSAAFH
jgi:hypothetical protein